MRSPIGWSFLATVGILGLDQGTKAWVAGSLALGESRPLLGGFLRLTRVHNQGAAFGLLPQQTGAFIAVSVAVAVALGAVLLAGRWKHVFGWVGGACLLAGAVGNLADRLRCGYVLDFLELPHWPVFNVADIAIVVGAGLLALGFLTGRVR